MQYFKVAHVLEEDQVDIASMRNCDGELDCRKMRLQAGLEILTCEKLKKDSLVPSLQSNLFNVCVGGQFQPNWV